MGGEWLRRSGCIGVIGKACGPLPLFSPTGSFKERFARKAGELSLIEARLLIFRPHPPLASGAAYLSHFAMMVIAIVVVESTRLTSTEEYQILQVRPCRCYSALVRLEIPLINILDPLLGVWLLRTDLTWWCQSRDEWRW